jgi:prepilin-type N-terminal cleavage/methylation domain-containing protein
VADTRQGRLRSQEGFTLLELMVASALMLVVMGIFVTTMGVVQKAVNRETGRSESNDQARLAVEELDREIRSGNLLYDPALETGPTGSGVVAGMSLRIYTQTNATSRNPGNRCVQWRIVSDELQRRDWATIWQEDPALYVTPWRVVADHVVNMDPDGHPNTSDAISAFVLDSDPVKGGRTVVISILVNQSRSSGRNVNIQESVTGRNTQYGYPNNICSVIPPY